MTKPGFWRIIGGIMINPMIYGTQRTIYLKIHGLFETMVLLLN